MLGLSEDLIIRACTGPPSTYYIECMKGFGDTHLVVSKFTYTGTPRVALQDSS
jgi:hypothetical protein